MSARLSRLPVLSLLLLCTCTAPSGVDVDPEVRQLEAARALVQWLVDAAELPGHDGPPADRWAVDRAERVFVICDFVPPERPLSDDPRVRRIPPSAEQIHFAEYGFDGTVYVELRLADDSSAVGPLRLIFRYSFGNVGAREYRFAFRGQGATLRAEGHSVTIS